MTRIYLVRHGETLSNVWKTLQGWSDTPLTEKGIQQGKELAILLKEMKPAAIYSSTSERAYDTACLINEYHDLKIQMTKGLKELNFGSFETQPEYMLGGNPRYIINFDWTQYNGENIDILTKRVGDTLYKIISSSRPTDRIICVTHSISILAALRYIDEKIYVHRMRYNQFIDNCSVTVLEFNESHFKVVSINTKNINEIYCHNH